MRSNRPAFAVRPLVALLAGLLLLTPLSPPSGAQTRALEKCFPAAGPAKITVLNSPKLAASVWDKNEVALVAEAAGRQVRDADVITRTKGERLEIACYPQPAEGAVHITLRVPVGSEVVWKIPATASRVKRRRAPSPSPRSKAFGRMFCTSTCRRTPASTSRKPAM